MRGLSQLLLGCRKNHERRAPPISRDRLTRQHGSAVYVENLARDEAGILGAKNSTGPAISSGLPTRPMGMVRRILRRCSVIQRGWTCPYRPSQAQLSSQDSRRREFRGKPLDHADHAPLLAE